MFLNYSLKWSVSLRRIMPNIEKLIRNQEIIAKELSSLKAEVNDLESLFHKLKNCGGGNNLSEENAYLEKQIDLTKQELIRLEVARGIQQIPIPKRDFSTLSSETSDVAAPSEKVSSTAAASVKPPQNAENKQNTKDSKKKEKPEKQENKKDKSDKPDAKKVEAPKEGPIDVSRLDLRIGKLVDVKKHPDADSLYVETVDVGKDQTITVVSGLVKHVPIEEMLGRMVVLLCNLKPAKMRGITSEAMVMCASTPEKVELLTPPAGAVPGDIVHVDGFPPNPDSVLNPKKKIFETVAPDLKTDSNLHATYKGHSWSVPGKGKITTQSLVGVNIK